MIQISLLAMSGKAQAQLCIDNCMRLQRMKAKFLISIFNVP